MRQGGYLYERARFPQGARSRPPLILTAQSHFRLDCLILACKRLRTHNDTYASVKKRADAAAQDDRDKETMSEKARARWLLNVDD